MLDNLGIIGYSGHSYVIIETAKSLNIPLIGYYERERMNFNPYNLDYLGNENEIDIQDLLSTNYIIGIGDNSIRKNIDIQLESKVKFQRLVHPSAILSTTAVIGEGTFISSNAIINALARIGRHGIINTGSIVEHECVLGDYVHVAPGAILSGNVRVGSGTFIGANSTIKQGVKIGENVIIGAGTVVIRDIPSFAKVVGNPSKEIK